MVIRLSLSLKEYQLAGRPDRTTRYAFLWAAFSSARSFHAKSSTTKIGEDYDETYIPPETHD